MGEVAYVPGLENVPVVTTTISTLDLEHEQIVVRGYDLIELASNLGYTEVAYLVLYGHLPDTRELDAFHRRLKEEAGLPEPVVRLLEIAPGGMALIDVVRTAVSLLAGSEDPVVLGEPSPEANLRKGISILAKMPTIVANAYRLRRGMGFLTPNPDLGYVENLLYMVTGEPPDELAKRAVEAIMTCSIEHELPNSTFAARVIASTLTDLYGAVVGAIASWKGPLHGGASAGAMELLLEIQRQGGVELAEGIVKERLARGERIMGFGHRVYRRRPDARAVLLSREFVPRLVDRRPDGPALYEVYRVVEQTMLREKGLYPNGDFPIGFIYYLLRIPSDVYTSIGVTARLPGLIAHITEQQANNRLFRPRAIYQGARGLTLAGSRG